MRFKPSVLHLWLGTGLLVLTASGCATSHPAAPAVAARAPVRFEAPREAPRKTEVSPAQSPAAAAKGEPPSSLYPPEVVHEARIELAREALSADNEAKAEAEAAEQMQRDIADAAGPDVALRHAP